MNLPVDILRICESEPIHAPGFAQPHGALLVMDDRLEVRAASESCANILGLSPSAMLGTPLDGWLDPATARKIRAAVEQARCKPLGRMHFSLPRAGVRQALDGRVFLDGTTVILDAEPLGAAEDRSRHLIDVAVTGLAALRQCRDAKVLAQDITRLVRDLTGFDRVMAYRFDGDWNGEVIGEARADHVRSYLGLNFPASDIPAQARALYLSAEVRQIPNVDYVPSALVSREVAVDIGASSLRSVSPVHLEYLRNMEVRATLVGSLIVNDCLWGLIACHHESGPRHLSGPERDVFNWICHDAAALLNIAEAHALNERAAKLASHQVRLLEGIHDGGLRGLMGDDRAADILGVVNADGFAFLSDEGSHSVGVAPSTEDMARIRRAILERHPEPLFVSHCLQRDLDLPGIATEVSGAIVIPVAGRHELTLAWFRRERRHEVHWGGNPGLPEMVGENGIVSPRKSFALFLERVEGQSLPWRPEELASAHRMLELIEIEVQRRLRAKADLLETGLTKLNEMVIITEAEPIDPPGPRIVMVSEAVERTTGYSAEELIGKTPRIFQGPLTDRDTLDQLRAAMLRWEQAQVQLINYTKAGEPFWVEIDIAPIADNKGWYTHWIAVQRDVTQRKQAERDLEVQRDQLRALADELLVARDAANLANQAKSAFLANMSHELRTPMHAIMSFSRLGLDRVDQGETDRLKKYFANIHDSGARLTHLLNDLLDLSKLEAGRMHMDRQPCEIGTIVDECAAEFEPLLAGRALVLEFDRPPGGVVAEVDRIRIGQVLRNLLSNAIKFSHEGGRVRVVLARADGVSLVDEHGAAIPSLRLTVADQGIGIPDDELEAVFDKFVQSSKTRTSSGGTGLGLAICREIVVAHGGLIRAAPAPGGGSIFEVLLPVGATTSAA